MPFVVPFAVGNKLHETLLNLHSLPFHSRGAVSEAHPTD